MTVLRIRWLLLFAVTQTIHAAELATVRCVDESAEEKANQSVDVGEIITCTAKPWCSQKWPENQDKTAPKAHLHKLKYFVYKAENERRMIGLKIQWSSLKSHLSSYIDDYTLSIFTPGMMSEFNICFRLDKDNIITSSARNATSIKFSYRHTCENNHCIPIQPAKEYYVELKPNPTYHLMSSTNVNRRRIQVPDCNFKQIRKSRDCRVGRKTRRIGSQRARKDTQPDHDISTRIESSGNVQFTATQSSSRDKREIGGNHGARKVLFLERMGDASSEPHSIAYQWLVTWFKKTGLVEVTYNKWETTKLVANPFNWIKEAVERADSIILLATPSNHETESNSRIDDWLERFFIQKSEVERWRKRFYLVSFHLLKNEHWPRLAYGEHIKKFKLTEETGQLLNAVNGGAAFRMKRRNLRELAALVDKVRKMRATKEIRIQRK